MNISDILSAESKTIDCEPPYDKVTEKGVAITSPNYPKIYDNNLVCQLTIRYGDNETVAITFVVFHVEKHSKCQYDYFAIHDGESTDSPLIGSKLCGTSPLGTTVRSTGNAMTLRFRTDGATTKTGFRLYAHPGNASEFDVIGNGWCRPGGCDTDDETCRVNGYFKD